MISSGAYSLILKYQVWKSSSLNWSIQSNFHHISPTLNTCYILFNKRWHVSWTFNPITDLFGFKPTILLWVLYLSHLFYVHFFLSFLAFFFFLDETSKSYYFISSIVSLLVKLSFTILAVLILLKVIACILDLLKINIEQNFYHFPDKAGTLESFYTIYPSCLSTLLFPCHLSLYMF